MLYDEDMDFPTDIEDIAPAAFDEMRNWASDCTWRDLDEHDIEELTHEELYNLVERYFDGGINNFLNGIDVPPLVLEDVEDLSNLDQSHTHETRPDLGL